jgi:hypothetical protein
LPYSQSLQKGWLISAGSNLRLQDRQRRRMRGLAAGSATATPLIGAFIAVRLLGLAEALMFLAAGCSFGPRRPWNLMLDV